VRHARLPAALAMDVLWSFALAAIVAEVVSGRQGGGPSLATIAAVTAGSFAVVRLLPATLGDRRARAVAVAASVLGLFLILHTEYAASDPPWRLGWVIRLFTEPRELLAGRRYVVDGVIVATLLWLVGVLRWSRSMEAADVLATATFGFAAVALAAVVEPPVHGPHPFGAIAAGYFVLAWCLLALYQTADGDEPLVTFAARWGAAFGVVAVAAGAFVLALSAFDPDTLGFLGPPGRAVLRGVGLAAVYTLGPVAAFVGWLFGLIPLHVRPSEEQPPRCPPDMPDCLRRPAPEPQGGTPMWLQVLVYTIAGGGAGVLALSFAMIVWFAVRRRGRRMQALEQRRSVERESTLAQDLGEVLGNLARRFRRAPRTASTVAIRRLYHQMLARAEADGLTRPPGATPLAFARSLDARYASAVPSEISSAFVRSRYGLADIDAGTVSQLREQWRSLIGQAPR
jgi:hypothetical protein